MPQPSDETTRRAMLLTAAAGLAAAASTPALAGPRELKLADLQKEADVACLYHCDFSDPQRFTQMLTNISNHYSAYGADPFALQLAVVAHGPGVKFFLESFEGTSWQGEAMELKLHERIEDVAKNGLRIHLCEITFNRLKIDKAKARSAEFISFVPSGVAAVAALQAKGFGYIKVG